MKTVTSFRANAHLLKLLGDQLIGDDRLAIFELVKNAYDADATTVKVELNLVESEPYIMIWDIDGHGMSKDIILERWMEIGTESKRNQNWKSSPKFKRLPLGEKGVGRLAVHKLGAIMQMNSKQNGKPEVQIDINWPNLINSSKYIEDAKVEIEELSQPKYFQNGDTGTRIVIKELNKDNWTRGDIRKLKRLLTSLTSPFKTVSDFTVDFTIPGREKDYNDLLDAQDVIDNALWKYHFSIDTQGNFSYKFEFTPPSLFKNIQSVITSGNNEKLELLPANKEERHSRNKSNRDRLLLNSSDLDGIGPIKGSFYIFSREKDILNATGTYQAIRQYLDEQSGMRIYRDGIRVFNYGEPNDDWLGLNAMRVNNPSKRVGTNSIIGNIELTLEHSRGLQEKTNREGFDENAFFTRFKLITSSALEHFYITHLSTRKQINDYKNIQQNNHVSPKQRFEENISEIRETLKRNKLDKELGGKLKQIENDYKEMQEVTLNSITGINLAVIFHEVERGIEQLNKEIKNNVPYESLKTRSSHLSKLLEGFSPLLRKNGKKQFMASKVIERTLEFSSHRFDHHSIIVSCPLLINDAEDFEIKAPSNLLLATLNNIIDNAIHWTKLKKETLIDEKYKPAIFITTLVGYFKEGPAIVIADNGPGFNLSPDEAIRPFNTTRPGGMGVGLYYADQVMSSIGGKMLITSHEDVDISPVYDGAVIVLVFNKDK